MSILQNNQINNSNSFHYENIIILRTKCDYEYDICYNLGNPVYQVLLINDNNKLKLPGGFVNNGAKLINYLLPINNSHDFINLIQNNSKIIYNDIILKTFYVFDEFGKITNIDEYSEEYLWIDIDVNLDTKYKSLIIKALHNIIYK
jgi:hypothetical protein